jgi:opacity protein-like surface antigen
MRKFVGCTYIILLSSTATFGQVIITPKLGINLLGDLEFRRGGPGLGVGYMFNKVGIEVEYMRYYHFYQDEEIDKIFNPSPGSSQRADIDTDAQVVATTLIVPIRKKEKYAVYVAPGFSVYNSWFTSPKAEYNSSQTDFGFHVAGGIDYKLRENIYLNSDMKYSYAIVDKARDNGYKQDFDFLRFSIGIKFKLGN